VILGEEELVEELRCRVAEVRATGGIPSSQLRLGAESLESAADRQSELLRPTRTGGAATRDRALAAVVLKDVCLATYGQVGLLTGLAQWGARLDGRPRTQDRAEEPRGPEEVRGPLGAALRI